MVNEFNIEAYLKNLTQRPGVYQMLNKDAVVIYVGKAKNLKKRVSSYFKKTHTDVKTQTMVSFIKTIETIITDTETEALILENTLIKKFKPKYNIIFRDDKSYPYIFVSSKHKAPALSYHRGVKRRKGDYFGPFPNAGAVHQTLQSLQKIFTVRQCADSVYNHRSRPCLQYQIKRCSAPCVDGFISEADYQQDVQHSLQFLQGKSFEVIDALGKQMDQASEQLEFENAAKLRDKIYALRQIQSQHLLNQTSDKDMDVIAIHQKNHNACICLMMYRGGNLWGSKLTYPKISFVTSDNEMLTAFLSQHYQELSAPPVTILLQIKLEDQDYLSQLFSEKHQQKIKISKAYNSHQLNLINLSITNAKIGLKQQQTQQANQQQRLTALQNVIALPKPPLHMECFDISHTQGQYTIASCVVFIDGIPDTKRYRQFNINGIQAGDDYAAMHQVLTRRYQRLKKENLVLPDLIIVDGGKGQLSQAIDVLKNLELDHIPLISVAKGEGRKAGLEILFTPYNLDGIDLDPHDPALHLINHIRDESHRFAITKHRQKRQKKQTQSQLEDIANVGAKTRKKLLMHFGGIAAIKNASIKELQKVNGISAKIAEKIYDYFHGEI